MANEIYVAELDQMLKEVPGEVFLIDLMNNEDFERNHLPGAVNIPAEDLRNHFSEIPKNKKVVVVCRRGLTKSDNAVRQLHESGFTNVKKLTGGTEGWINYKK